MSENEDKFKAARQALIDCNIKLALSIYTDQDLIDLLGKDMSEEDRAKIPASLKIMRGAFED